MYQVVLSKQVSKTIENANPKLKTRLRKGIQSILDKPYEGKSLQGKFEGLMSLRVGEWRIVYEVDTKESIIIVHGIGPRGQIYRS